MGNLTAQAIAAYYERFKTIEVAFTKDMVQTTGLVTEQIHLKCGSDFWPCIFYATSFQGAKVAVNIKSGLPGKLQKVNNAVSLRLCFKTSEKGNPITFFIAGRVTGMIPYKDSEEVSLFTIQFTQRPPDDLIEIIGRILDANINSSKRKDDKIVLTADSQRKLKLLSKEAATFIQAVPRRCLLRELSFSNAKLIMMGVAKFLIDKDTALRLDFEDPRESFLIKGKFTNPQEVEGKKEMVAFTMAFDEAQIPMGYKIRINDYFNSTRLDNRVPSGETVNTADSAAK